MFFWIRTLIDCWPCWPWSPFRTRFQYDPNRPELFRTRCVLRCCVIPVDLRGAKVLDVHFILRIKAPRWVSKSVTATKIGLTSIVGITCGYIIYTKTLINGYLYYIYIDINNDYTWMSGCQQSIYSWLISYWVISYTPLLILYFYPMILGCAIHGADETDWGDVTRLIELLTTGWWFFALPLWKNDGVKVSWDDD